MVERFSGARVGLIALVAVSLPWGGGTVMGLGGPALAGGAQAVEPALTPTMTITNGTAFTVHVQGQGAKEVIIPPGGQKDILGVTGSTVRLETLASPSAIPNEMTVAEIGQGVGVATELGRLVVQNALKERIDVHIDGSWASALATDGAFTQDMKSGTYAVGIYDGEKQISLLERTIAVRERSSVTWVIGKEPAPVNGFVTLRNLGKIPIQVSLNQVDRGRVMPGTERTLMDIDPKAAAAAPKAATIQAGPIWGGGDGDVASSGESSTQASKAPAAPQAASTAVKETAPVDSLADIPGIKPEDIAKAKQQNLEKKKVGTLRVGNQTNHKLKIYVNGEEVGWLEPKGELTLEEQPMGDYQVEAEDARAGAFVRARLTINRPGQIVVWNATGWW